MEIKMQWITENLQILATLGSALAVYLMIRQSSKKDIVELGTTIGDIKSDVKEIKFDIANISTRVGLLEQRLSRFEGVFEERGRWENRKTK